jgi:hypothetical protein
MIAYAFGDEPIKCLIWLYTARLGPQIFLKLNNPDVEKHAHNANFERNAFKTYGFDVLVEQEAAL